MARRFMIRKAVSSALAVGALAAGLVAAAGPAAQAGASTPSSVTWAEAPGQTPDYIFPFYPGSLCTVANTDQFQMLMYRPLYWFGNGATPNLNPQLSLADTPVYSSNDTTVTVNLKNYKWSDGESVTPQDVVFFMNMYHAQKAATAATCRASCRTTSRA